MARVHRYSAEDRRRAKAASRVQDESDLVDGRVSRAELRAANGIFSALDLSSSVIRSRRPVDR